MKECPFTLFFNTLFVGNVIKNGMYCNDTGIFVYCFNIVHAQSCVIRILAKAYKQHRDSKFIQDEW